jgi:L-aspartate semialdehyde sulfurtransferase
LEAWGKGTDCYPRKYIKTKININTINEFTLFNPRNAYQNYNVAVNTTQKDDSHLHGYPAAQYAKRHLLHFGRTQSAAKRSRFAHHWHWYTYFSGRCTGFCGLERYQFHTTKPKNEFGVPVTNAATIAVIGNLKEMSPEYLQAVYYEKYGVSMFVGIGIPIPVLDEDMARRVSIANSQIETSVLDYGTEGMPKLGQVTYEELQSGTIKVAGKKIRTAPVSSLSKARKIAAELKEWLQNGKFEITQPVQLFPKIHR